MVRTVGWFVLPIRLFGCKPSGMPFGQEHLAARHEARTVQFIQFQKKAPRLPNARKTLGPLVVNSDSHKHPKSAML